MTEEWRIIKDFPDYEVSSHGKVRRIKKYRNGLDSNLPGRILRPYKNRDGYLQIILRRNKKQFFALVHRLVAFSFIGDPPTKDHGVAHNDGVPDNNIPSNLRWATQLENNTDKKIHGTYACGEKIKRNKLTEKDVKEIFYSNEPNKVLKRKYGVSVSNICGIKRGENWKHLGLC